MYDIEHLCMRLAAWYYRQKDAPFSRTANPAMGVVVEPTAMPLDIAEALDAYVRTRV
jgi:hypothetical protein